MKWNGCIMEAVSKLKASMKIMAQWCIVVLVIFVSTVRVDCLADSTGFISIDCGLAADSSFEDSDTKLTYVSDDQFIDTGVSYNIITKYANNRIFKQLLTVRSFPNGTRNCYTLSSLTVGSKYLVRAIFMYGNYDNLNKPPIFDIHLGVNYWDTFNSSDIYSVFLAEIIAVATADYLQVCLINKNLGTPFISWLDLRPLNTSIYKVANSNQSLVLSERLNFGAGNSSILRYPDDPYDRIWGNYMSSTWKEISNSSVTWDLNPYATPSLVMQTAATTVNTKQSLDYSWTCNDELTVFLVIVHVDEIQGIPRGELREFDVLANGELVFNHSFTNRPGEQYSRWLPYTHTTLTRYNVSVKANSNSTLPPIWNALELYKIAPLTEVPTYSDDVTAMNIIKENYQVKKGWSGDPCVPTKLSWTGVTCTIGSTNIPRITGLNLSSCGLTGAIIFSLGKLTGLKTLDLSDNDLSGVLPTSLDQLEALTYLDISGNDNISTILPPGLLEKQKNGILTYKFGKTAAPSKNKKSPVVLIAVIGVVVLVLIVVAIVSVLCLKRGKNNQVNIIPKPNDPHGKKAGQYDANISTTNVVHEKLNFDNRQFSYKDLEKITNNFQNNIGGGGFGGVYAGVLENGTHVAVKMRSQSSSQGIKEFLAEAQNLTRVHHRNLVSLIGYCMDGGCMALVYEYMQEGTLQDKLLDNARPLTWKHRLRIAYESALGLEYLHKACNPPLIHRDVKTSNILLNVNLEAKIADFGLSRAFNNDASSHVSTAVVGTPGYLDPEYYSSDQLSEKSDVYSFGVVLLEIITGRPPTIAGPEGGHVAKWATQNLLRGDIESIVDERMHGQYDINSVWKVTDLACQCTEHSSAKRPTMNVVVAELKESLDLEIATEGTRSRSTTSINPHNSSGNDNFVSDVSQNSIFNMDYMVSMTRTDPAAR